MFVMRGRSFLGMLVNRTKRPRYSIEKGKNLKVTFNIGKAGAEQVHNHSTD